MSADPVASPAAPDTSTKPRLLIVDDNPIDQRLAASVVQKELGWQVEYAEGGVPALAAMRAALPDVVLTDLQMPEMDGLQLVDEIRARYLRTPVVLMTAHGSEQIAMEALRRGAANYVPKSNMARALPTTLEQVHMAARHAHQVHEVEKRLARARLYFVLENDPTLVPGVVQRLVRDLSGMLRLSAREETRVSVALLEALLNALYHGNLEISSDLKNDGLEPFYQIARERSGQSPYQERRIHVTAEYTADDAVFVIRDEGSGFDVSKLPDPTDPENLCKPTGRGALLMRTFMNEVSYNPAGNEVTLRINAVGSPVGKLFHPVDDIDD